MIIMFTLHFMHFVLSSAWAGDVLMLDLNNSGEEVRACSKAVLAANAKNNTSDSVFVLGGGAVVTAQSVDDKLTELEEQGYDIDTIVISGHDGSGHVFSPNGSSIRSSELKKIIARHKKTKASLKSLALWACYGTNANSAMKYWMKNVSPNITTPVGYTTQAPDNTKPGNFALLNDYCLKRNEIAQATSEQEITDQFNSLTEVKNWSFGICKKTGVCAKEYRRKGATNPSCFHTYRELMDRCSEFDPDRSQTDLYNQYMAASHDAGKYCSPPQDGENVYTPEGKLVRVDNPLRTYYDQLQLWRHCAEKLRTEAKFDMPVPATTIRLIKFDTVKQNFARLQKPELDQYNAHLSQLGLDAFRLDNLENLQRCEINGRLEDAVAKLTEMAGSSRRAARLLDMANGFDLSLRQLDWHCTDFRLVHENAQQRSPCVANYGGKPSWPLTK